MRRIPWRWRRQPSTCRHGALHAPFAPCWSKRSPARSAILPAIRPLGDVDEDAAMFDMGSDAFFDLLPPIGSTERLLLLARLVRPWRERLPDHVRALFGNEEIAIPATTADAIWLARDLASLMDQVETEAMGWSTLSNIVSEDLPNWWQVTLDFLGIVTSLWPDVLASAASIQSCRTSQSADRIRSRASCCAARPPGPLSQPVPPVPYPPPHQLLAAIARLPQGALVSARRRSSTWTQQVGQLLANTLDSPSIFGHPAIWFEKPIEPAWRSASRRHPVGTRRSVKTCARGFAGRGDAPRRHE